MLGQFYNCIISLNIIEMQHQSHGNNAEKTIEKHGNLQQSNHILKQGIAKFCLKKDL